MSTFQQTEDQFASGFSKKRDLCIVRGDGASLFDDKGREFIDCVGGQGVNTLGHANPTVAQAISEQARTLISCPELFYNDQRAEFLSDLSELMPEGMRRTYLCNSGAEAVEAAIKIARLSTKKTKIVGTVRGFHGRTMGALSATHEPKYREAFEPLLPGFTHIPFNNAEVVAAAIDDNTAAVIVEPIQGEGGVYEASREFFEEVRKLTSDRGALLIVDEIQTGFGRTGLWFGFEHLGIKPDLITMGKAIAAGVPMGAVAIADSIENIAPGLHGTTFGGNPLACAAGRASLAQMKLLNIPRQAQVKGDWLMTRLRTMGSPLIKEVRGKGLLIGIDLRIKVTPILRALENKGVLALPAGMSVLRLLPPAVITEEQMTSVIKAIDIVLKEAATA